jgi:pyridoxal phosphate enzyme (YggS family)
MSIKLLTDETINQLNYNFENVRRNMRDASVGKDVVLLAATKTVDAEIINYAIDELGLTDIGENKVQELLSKYDSLHLDKVNLHFIGRLQTNKVKYIVDKVCLIHSVDSLKLACEIEKQAAKHGIVSNVLVEVNIAAEESKGGIMPSELGDFLKQIKQFSHVNCQGIMVIPPDCKSEEKYTEYFTKTKELADAEFTDFKPIISMGMTDSYVPAIKCGADIIRVGSGLFGKRDYQI